MEPVSIGLLVIAASVAVVAYFLVPALIQLKKTLAEADRLMNGARTGVDNLNTMIEEVRPLIASLNETAGDVSELVKGVQSGVEKLDSTVESVKEVGDTVRHINSIVEMSVKGSVVEIAAYMAGLKAIVATLYKSFNRFKHKED